MNKLIVNPGETRTPNLAGWFHGSIQLSYWASFNVLIKIQKKMKSIFWSGGWTRTIDLQGPSPGALLLSYATWIYINYAQWAI